jgi:hypothetical protein
MADRALNVSLDASGEWFLPENPGRTIPGRLRYTPDHSELELHEAFRPVRGAFRVGDAEAYPLVHGATTDGDRITLFGAQRAGFAINFGSAGLRGPERLLSTRLVVGAPLPTDFTYPEVSFRVPGLQVWLSRQVVEQSFDTETDGGGMTARYRVSGLPEEKMRVETINATLGWGIHSRHSSTPTTVSVEASGWVRVRPHEPRPIEWFLEQLQKISTLLSLLAGSGMSPDCINASVDESRHVVSVMVPLRDAKYCSFTTLHDFYMPRGNMEAELADIVGNWFDVYPKVDTPSRLATSVLTSDKLWLHVEFLSLMQALEGFHRALYEGVYLSKSEYASVEATLNAAIPPVLGTDHKKSLRSRIHYGYQVSLAKRLGELASRLSSPIRQLIFGADGKLPRHWIDTRNYYTHWDEELRAGVLDGEGLYYANVRMRMFLRVLYLNLISIPDTAIVRALGNASNISQHLVELNIIERRRSDPGDQSGTIMTVLQQNTTDPTEHNPSAASQDIAAAEVHETPSEARPHRSDATQGTRRIVGWTLIVLLVAILAIVVVKH